MPAYRFTEAYDFVTKRFVLNRYGHGVADIVFTPPSYENSGIAKADRKFGTDLLIWQPTRNGLPQVARRYRIPGITAYHDRHDPDGTKFLQQLYLEEHLTSHPELERLGYLADNYLRLGNQLDARYKNISQRLEWQTKNLNQVIKAAAQDLGIPTMGEYLVAIELNAKRIQITIQLNYWDERLENLFSIVQGTTDIVHLHQPLMKLLQDLALLAGISAEEVTISGDIHSATGLVIASDVSNQPAFDHDFQVAAHKLIDALNAVEPVDLFDISDGTRLGNLGWHLLGWEDSFKRLLRRSK